MAGGVGHRIRVLSSTVRPAGWGQSCQVLEYLLVHCELSVSVCKDSLRRCGPALRIRRTECCCLVQQVCSLVSCCRRSVGALLPPPPHEAEC